MKRIVLFFIVTHLLACSSHKNSYLDSFNGFIHGLQKLDIKLISDFSTETTAAMIRKIILSDEVTYILVDDENLGRIVNWKSVLQDNIVVINGLVADDGKSARVWFKLYDSSEVYSLRLVYQKDRWLVDIPLENFMLY